MKVYLKWIGLTLADWALLLTVPVVAPILSAFTRADYREQDMYKWGGLYGTFDNPPQGDRGYVTKRSLFPNVTTGFKGYINRTLWIIRNPLYGFAKVSGIEWKDHYVITVKGNPEISDKYKIPGWVYLEVRDGKELKGFEFYAVLPYTSRRNVRMRVGWKIKTDKFQRRGFAQLVNTFNPFDGYGNN